MDVSVAFVDPDATNPGPIDNSVLYDQDKHVSSAVWDGQERGALRCHEHTSKLDQWTLTAKQIDLVERAGFGYLRLIPAISLDNPLISALVERWRRETNTFHMTVGEMTVTLKDVAILLGLAIEGEPVIGVTYTSCSSVCERFLGQAPGPGYASGGMVKLSWLKENFSRCSKDAPIEVVEWHTRAYLLYLIGSTIFSTTTGNKVPVMYLPLFENFDQAGSYAWGAAALAFLYRALGNASLRTQSTISGCLTLLQCWSYFHLNVGRLKLHQNPVQDRFPYVLKWKGKQSGPSANRDVVFYRKTLDSLQPCDVEWLPYRNLDSTVIPDHIKSNLYIGRSRTMLICFDKAERHLPDRCMRQYGMPQPIPIDVERWERKSRGVDGGIDLSGKMEAELNEWYGRKYHIVNAEDDIDESEYMPWYLRITRKFVGRPISLSFEFQRMNTGMRDIAHISDMISTKGLDQQQLAAISQIRCIAHECLKDQIGGAVAVTATSPTDLAKRVRGKEKVRRKGMGKRRRKDDMIQYHAGSEDDQSQFYDATVVVDQLQLRTTDTELDQLQLRHEGAEDDTVQLVDTTDKINGSQLYDPASCVDGSKLAHLTNNVRNSHLSGSVINTPQFCSANMDNSNTGHPHISNPHPDAYVNDQHGDAEVNDFHSGDVQGIDSKPENDFQRLSDDVGVGGSRPPDAHVSYSQVSDGTKEVYDSHNAAHQIEDQEHCRITHQNGTLSSLVAGENTAQ